MLSKACISSGIADDKHALAPKRVLAEGLSARHLFQAAAYRAFVVLRLCVEQSHQADGGPADGCGQFGEIIEFRFRLCAQKLERLPAFTFGVCDCV